MFIIQSKEGTTRHPKLAAQQSWRLLAWVAAIFWSASAVPWCWEAMVQQQDKPCARAVDGSCAHTAPAPLWMHPAYLSTAAALAWVVQCPAQEHPHRVTGERAAAQAGRIWWTLWKKSVDCVVVFFPFPLPFPSHMISSYIVTSCVQKVSLETCSKWEGRITKSILFL